MSFRINWQPCFADMMPPKLCYTFFGTSLRRYRAMVGKKKGAIKKSVTSGMPPGMLSVFLKKRKVCRISRHSGDPDHCCRRLWVQHLAAGRRCRVLTLFLQQKMSENADGVFSSIEKAELEFELSLLPSGSMPAISGLTLLIRLSCCRNLNFASVGLI